ncbi:MAG: hypothetical protein Q8N83_08500 [Ignavibacteria bacterium]|nr:hypothetical protein [Ignavibacteria bacterium]
MNEIEKRKKAIRLLLSEENVTTISKTVKRSCRRSADGRKSE